MSWSPFERKIAFIEKSLKIYDTSTAGLTTVHLSSPFFVNWTKQGIFVLYVEDGKTSFCVVDPQSFRIEKIKDLPDADLVLQTKDQRALIVLSSKIKTTTIGVETNHQVYEYNIGTGTVKKVYFFSKIYQTKKVYVDYLKGWQHAGLNPLDDSLLIIEYVRPPVVMPYSRVIALDYATAKTETIVEDEQRKIYVSGSWSPDGRHVALSDSNGDLEISDFPGGKITTKLSVKGLYPAWNPKGSQIFSGGFVFDTNGNNSEELVSGNPESVGAWSFDGTQLAVISHNRLYLFEHFRPGFTGPDKPFDEGLSKKVLMLRDLHHENLISDDDYRERRNRLLNDGRGDR